MICLVTFGSGVGILATAFLAVVAVGTTTTASARLAAEAALTTRAVTSVSVLSVL